MNILESLKDLELQAKTEHSHYYTASVLRDAIILIEKQNETIDEMVNALEESNCDCRDTMSGHRKCIRCKTLIKYHEFFE